MTSKLELRMRKSWSLRMQRVGVQGCRKLDFKDSRIHYKK
jgi:hypothetical protein